MCLNRLTHVLVSCREKINELHQWMSQLESEKFDHMERLKRQKYEVRPRPCRLHIIMSVNDEWDEMEITYRFFLIYTVHFWIWSTLWISNDNMQTFTRWDWIGSYKRLRSRKNIILNKYQILKNILNIFHTNRYENIILACLFMGWDYASCKEKIFQQRFGKIVN